MRFRRHRLQSQLLFSVVAALAVAALSVELIGEAVSSAQSMVVADARHTLGRALTALIQQYRERAASDPEWSSLPFEARDFSLHAVAQIVVKSYPDVEGGYYDRRRIGTTWGAHANLDRAIDALIARASSQGSAASVTSAGKDLFVMEAHQIAQADFGVWAVKRLPGRNDPWTGQRAFLLAALALAALVSVGGAIATGGRLHRGIAQIRRGLIALEQDFEYALPRRNDELGEISAAINRMAAVRRVLEAEVAREERLRSMGRLVAAVAHEIRNPLNSIRLSMEMIERRLSKNTLRSDDLRMVCCEVDRLNDLLTNLLTFERAKTPQPERQQLLPVLNRCVQLLRAQAEERGIRLSVADHEASIEAVFDAQRLTQALLNLVLNGIQATPRGGSVRIAIARHRDEIQVIVRDAGPGLSGDQKRHLFEAFYTTKTSGTGLGLAVSRELVTSMGGQLTYEDAKPGAQFVICLPASVETYG